MPNRSRRVHSKVYLSRGLFWSTTTSKRKGAVGKVDSGLDKLDVLIGLKGRGRICVGKRKLPSVQPRFPQIKGTFPTKVCLPLALEAMTQVGLFAVTARIDGANPPRPGTVRPPGPQAGIVHATGITRPADNPFGLG